MDLALQVVQVLIQGVTLGIKFAPAIIQDLELAYALATSGTTLTDDQKAQADAAVANAHAALQAQIALDAASDNLPPA